MKQLAETKLSVLDLAPIVRGGTAADAFKRSVALARHVEALDFTRYWVAEHHNIPGVASSATAVVIGHVAGATKTIRVGSGGIMLPNHAPLVVAEQFGTLESLYPGRIDLGLGRAPGTDPTTTRALRRDLNSRSEEFADQLDELRGYFAPRQPGTVRVRAVPGEGLDVPVYLLGSSGYSAQLAGYHGLPFAFASHFAPAYLMQALELYRSAFRPSTVLDKPYAMVGVNVMVADTDAEAEMLFTSAKQKFLALVRGTLGPLQPPVESMDALWNPGEAAAVARFLGVSAVGSPDTVHARLDALIERTQADELIVVTDAFDFARRVRSFDLLAQTWRGLDPARAEAGRAAAQHAEPSLTAPCSARGN